MLFEVVLLDVDLKEVLRRVYEAPSVEVAITAARSQAKLDPLARRFTVSHLCPLTFDDVGGVVCGERSNFICVLPVTPFTTTTTTNEGAR